MGTVNALAPSPLKPSSFTGFITQHDFHLYNCCAAAEANLNTSSRRNTTTTTTITITPTTSREPQWSRFHRPTALPAIGAQ